MYSSVQHALEAAFNPIALFNNHARQSWQMKVEAKYRELRNASELDITRQDKLAQAGMTAQLLRRELSPGDYALLMTYHTIGGDYEAVIENWEQVEKLLQQSCIRQSVKDNSFKLRFMALKVLKPRFVKKITFVADDDAKKSTVERQQREVKQVIMGLINQAEHNVYVVLESAGLLYEGTK